MLITAVSRMGIDMHLLVLEAAVYQPAGMPRHMLKRSMSGRHIYLVPGFFGFSSIGDLNYFYKVADTLREVLDERGLEATIFDCTTKPTASIRRRAEWVLNEMLDYGCLDADEIHFVGHSTGGLDIRLLLTPGVRLLPEDTEERISQLAASCTTISTPHFGTPLAGFFTTLPGRHLLEILTLLATTEAGRFSLFAASKAIGAMARLDDFVGLDQTFLDVWTKRVIGRLSMKDDDPIFHFFREVSQDQGAVIQLTPESMNLFNAAVTDHPDVHYASVLTAAPPPPAGYRWRDALAPARVASRGVFTLLYYLAAREHRHYPYPHPGEQVLEELRELTRARLDAGSNDGIVPTLSQVHGQVLGLAHGDHLDVVGQYDTGQPYSDWLPSGSGFDDAAFRQTWSWVADSICKGVERRARGAG